MDVFLTIITIICLVAVFIFITKVIESQRMADRIRRQVMDSDMDDINSTVNKLLRELYEEQVKQAKRARARAKARASYAYSKSRFRVDPKPGLQSEFGVLGLSANASAADVKSAYRKLSKIHHPDMSGGDSNSFDRITKAKNNCLAILK